MSINLETQYLRWTISSNGVVQSFVDKKSGENKSCLDMFLPAHLGWWGIITSYSPYVEATYTDDTEYLLAKCAGWDCGLSPMVFTPETYASSYNLRRLGDLIKKWETLRLSGYFKESDKVKLRVPGAGFTLVEEKGRSRIRRMENIKHKIDSLDPASGNWTYNNGFKSQPAKLRIQGLMSIADYNNPSAVTLADFSDTSAFNINQAAPGTSISISSSSEQIKIGDKSGCIKASGPQGSKNVPTWGRVGQMYASIKNAGGTGGMGVWIYGDGKGELLNFQISNPSWMSSGIADHYVTIDFTGWRYLEFVEPEGDRLTDYSWPYLGSAYAMYRELVSYGSLESMSIWCNNLPSDGSIECYLSPVKALPLIANKLVNPSVTINGKTITFPVEIDSMSYLEYNSPTDCKLYSPQGDLIREITPQTEAPTLIKGENTLKFACDSPATGSARAIVTVISIGQIRWTTTGIIIAICIIYSGYSVYVSALGVWKFITHCVSRHNSRIL